MLEMLFPITVKVALGICGKINEEMAALKPAKSPVLVAYEDQSHGSALRHAIY